jgi:hypothetical protein
MRERIKEKKRSRRHKMDLSEISYDSCVQGRAKEMKTCWAPHTQELFSNSTAVCECAAE